MSGFHRRHWNGHVMRASCLSVALAKMFDNTGGDCRNVIIQRVFRTEKKKFVLTRHILAQHHGIFTLHLATLNTRDRLLLPFPFRMSHGITSILGSRLPCVLEHSSDGAMAYRNCRCHCNTTKHNVNKVAK